MILVRNIFRCQYGKAGEVARVLAETRAVWDRAGGARLLTDLSGPFDTVVVEETTTSLDEYQRRLQEEFADPRIGEVFGRLAGLIASGSREYFTIEAAG
ncbi:MAG TPA: hypothetical protein VFL91_21795 [Thermomicrobiales bacterium]|nr:hypothetical protein [Thermomicrobiales bacterium]